MHYHINGDAFASGQIGSKLWLCEVLETVFDDPVKPHPAHGLLSMEKQVIWLYGGWYGITNLLLQSRKRLRIEHVRSFDIDPVATRNAEMINENWVWREWAFKAFTVDCNKIDYAALGQFYTRSPDIIINTSTEHFDSMDWFDGIPFGTRVVLQCNNLPDPDHLFHIESQAAMKEMFPLSKIEYSGELSFVYADSRFTRFMLIGKK